MSLMFQSSGKPPSGKPNRKSGTLGFQLTHKHDGFPVCDAAESQGVRMDGLAGWRGLHMFLLFPRLWHQHALSTLQFASYKVDA